MRRKVKKARFSGCACAARPATVRPPTPRRAVRRAAPVAKGVGRPGRAPRRAVRCTVGGFGEGRQRSALSGGDRKRSGQLFASP